VRRCLIPAKGKGPSHADCNEDCFRAELLTHGAAACIVVGLNKSSPNVLLIKITDPVLVLAAFDF
jgi:hypothetical protein